MKEEGLCVCVRGVRSCDIAAAARLRISVFPLRGREQEHGGER